MSRLHANVSSANLQASIHTCDVIVGRDMLSLLGIMRLELVGYYVASHASNVSL